MKEGAQNEKASEKGIFKNRCDGSADRNTGCMAGGTAAAVGQLPASDTDRAAHTEPCCDFICDKKRYEPIV